MTKRLNKTLRLLAALTSLLTLEAVANDINLATLGDLKLSYENAVAVNSYPGKSVSAEVAIKKGEAYSLDAPGRVQQIRYLVEVGGRVDRGQAFAELRGPQMHHLLSEIEFSRKLLVDAERRFNSNKLLYEKKAIKESQWATISEKYYAAKLQYEHLRHFNDLVISENRGEDIIVIGAPISGIVNYSIEKTGLQDGDNIAFFVPESSIRMKTALPLSLRNDLVSLDLASCQLPVSSVGAVVENYFITAWSAPVEPLCDVILGQILLVTPLYKVDAYKVPMEAVFEWQRNTSILIRDGSWLKVITVSLLASRGGDYIVTSGQNLQGAAVLVTSVSAVQGVLLGMGGE